MVWVADLDDGGGALEDPHDLAEHGQCGTLAHGTDDGPPGEDHGRHDEVAEHDDAQVRQLQRVVALGRHL